MWAQRAGKALNRKGTESMAARNVYREALEAAFDFDKRRLWEKYSNYHYFAVNIPRAAEPMFGVVMGQAGEEFGLALCKGLGGLRHLRSLMSVSGAGDDEGESADYLSFGMERYAALPPEERSFYRKAGYAASASSRVPVFLSKPPGARPRMANEQELEQFLYVIRGVLQADRQGDFNPSAAAPEYGVLTLNVTGDAAAPRVTAELRPYEVPKQQPEVLLPTAAPNLKALPRHDATWLVGLPAGPLAIQGDDRSLRVLLVVDDASEFIFEARPILGDDVPEAAKALLRTLQDRKRPGPKGLPGEILFSSQKLRDALAPLLGAAGVKCAYVPDIPKLQHIAQEMFQHLGAALPGFRGHPDPPEVPPPARGDLAGWKAADKALCKRLAESAGREGWACSSRPAKRYFRHEDAGYFLNEYERLGAVQAYVEWCVLGYRPTRKSETHAEKMLAQGLPQAERMLLEARLEAHPSLYRVEGHDPKAETIALEDVLLGGHVTVNDRLLSQTITDGVFLTGRAFAAGDFRFFASAGPPLGPAEDMDVAAFLQDAGVELTPAGLRRDAHVFGWLWQLREERQAKRPRLCNTDGEDLVWHTASFHVVDEPRVRQALLQRDDIDYDEGADEFSWIREAAEHPAGMWGITRLGRLEFVSDELVVTVNSAGRCARARQWIEKMPGVTYRGVKTRRWDEKPEERPMDEKMARDEPQEEPSPEALAAAREMFRQHYMAWVDMPLPVLGGKSPRQTCQTEAGRQKVAMMIRAMPDPMGNAAVEVPRQAMLQELGLDRPADRAEQPRPQGPPPLGEYSQAPLRPKVGRNDPCPCGSGKKYKKCCGR
jgi:hypothetical protein